MIARDIPYYGQFREMYPVMIDGLYPVKHMEPRDDMDCVFVQPLYRLIPISDVIGALEDQIEYAEASQQDSTNIKNLLEYFKCLG